MAKPQPIRIPSDDYTMELRGKTYRPHEGEWVELIPVQTAADARAMHIVSQLQSDVEAAEGDAEAALEVARIANEQMYVLASSLAQRVIAWTWTDMRGEPLAQPSGDPELFLALPMSEFHYLLNLNEESPLGKLNGSHDSDSTSSGTKSSQPARTASRNGAKPQNASTARNRTKA